MASRNFLILVTISLLALITGCSGSALGPVAPDALPAVTQTPVADRRETEAGSNRVPWGLWSIAFDPWANSVSVEPARELAAHYNITDMLLPPACNDCLDIAVNSFNPVTRIMDVDVTLRNPTPVAGRDVRGILFTNPFGHSITNADAWSADWDKPGGQNINPFRAYAKTETNRIFAGLAEHVENFKVYIPSPPVYAGIMFAVDASWPGNCWEPYAIQNFIQDGELQHIIGSQCDIYVDVLDWQDDVNSVRIAVPDITGEDYISLSHVPESTWTVTLTNAEGALPGDYSAQLVVTSANSGAKRLYKYVTITVAGSPAPVVTGIDPSQALSGASMHDVDITGANFLAPCEVELSHASTTITTYNVEVLGPTSIECDFNIPLLADIGYYDVKVINSDEKEGIGEGLFLIIQSSPVVSGIDPDSGHAGESLEGVTITGANFVGPATVEFHPETGDPFTADNVDVVNPNTITCDVNIPFDEQIALFDVKVINNGGQSDIGEDMFEVLCPVPEVLGIEPDFSRRGTTLAGVLIDGDNFYGATGDVRLKRDGEADIVATNVGFDSWEQISCDIEIPIDAGLGDYDVEVINECGETGIGVAMFEIDYAGWANTWGNDIFAGAYCLARDAGGNIIVGGTYSGTTDLDPDPAEVIERPSNGGQDISISKFNPDGDLIWVMVIGGAGDDKAESIAVDGGDNIYIAGSFKNIVDFDPGLGIANRGSNGGDDSFILKLTPNGIYQWVMTWGCSSDDAVTGIEISGAYLYISGMFKNTLIDLDPDPVGADTHTSNGWNDIYLSKFDLTGDFVWGRTMGGSYIDIATDVGVDSAGNVCITGYFHQMVDFNPEAGEDIHSAGDTPDAFLTLFNASGGYQWTHSWGGTATESGEGVAFDTLGNIYIAGNWSETSLDFDPDTVGEDTHSGLGFTDCFLLKLDTSGDYKWGRTWGGTDREMCFDLAVSSAGDIIVSGQFAGTADLDPATGAEFAASGMADAYVSTLDDAGLFQWAVILGGDSATYPDACEAVDVDAAGKVVAAGYFAGDVDFNPDLVGEEIHATSGVQNAFVVKYLSGGNW